jgi:hypothetical protein
VSLQAVEIYNFSHKESILHNLIIIKQHAVFQNCRTSKAWNIAINVNPFWVQTQPNNDSIGMQTNIQTWKISGCNSSVILSYWNTKILYMACGKTLLWTSKSKHSFLRMTGMDSSQLVAKPAVPKHFPSLSMFLYCVLIWEETYHTLQHKYHKLPWHCNLVLFPNDRGLSWNFH